MAPGTPITEIHNEIRDVLEALVGHWRIEITNAEFLDEKAELTGRMSVSWLDNDPGFHQRFHGRLSADGTRIEAAWTESHDSGETWQHNVDVTYIKT
jgi:hypothetical protein